MIAKVLWFELDGFAKLYRSTNKTHVSRVCINNHFNIRWIINRNKKAVMIKNRKISLIVTWLSSLADEIPARLKEKPQ